MPVQGTYAHKEHAQMSVPTSLNDLIAAAEASSNQSENTSGTFERSIPDEGPVVMRFIEYIEFGPQKQTFGGKPKPDCLEAQFTFEILNKTRIRDVEKDGATIQFTDTISNRYAIKLNEKSGFRKLWNAMTYGRENIKHVLRMINEPFKGNIKHNVVPEANGKPERTFANLEDAAGNIAVYSPFIEKVDEDTGDLTKVELKVRENIRPVRIFLWDHPTKETWDSLFIDGTSERKNADGTVTSVSKNWIQERIIGSPAYPGSSLEAMLSDLGGLNLDPNAAPAEPEVQTVEDDPLEGVGQTSPLQKAPAKPVAAPPAAAKPKAAQSATTKPKAAVAASTASADLAALGLE